MEWDLSIMEWDSNKAWRRQMERRVYEVASLVKGNQSAQADRIADVVEQIDEVRGELQRVSEKLDKVAEYVKTNVRPNSKGVTNGSAGNGAKDGAP